jgi:hypothetical protein
MHCYCLLFHCLLLHCLLHCLLLHCYFLLLHCCCLLFIVALFIVNYQYCIHFLQYCESGSSQMACGTEELPRCWADSETRPQGPALVKDRKAGPRAGLSRPGQPRRQPDASRSTVSAVPSLNWARAHETGSRPRMGPDAGE